MHPRLETLTTIGSIAPLAFFASIVTSTFASTELILGDAEACAQLLKPSAATGVMPASVETVRELTSRLEVQSPDASESLVEQLRRITDALVTKGSLTRAQAETVFADRVLGDFGKIFLKYAIAELRARGFDDDQVIEFVFHFEDAYNAETRVEFALDVARRILVTVNDGTSLRSGSGIDQFKQTYEALGVDAKSWARFASVWEAVRHQHLPMIVQFILTNLNRTADRLDAEVRARTDQTVREWVERSKGWTNFLMPAHAPPMPDPHDVAREYLDGLRIPEFITDIDCLKLERSAPPELLDLACKAEPRFEMAKFLARLELSPPYGREYLLGEQIAHMTVDQLEALQNWNGFARLSETMRQRAAEASRRLVEIRTLSEAIGVELIRLRKPNRPKSDDVPRFERLDLLTAWVAADLIDARTKFGRDVGAAVTARVVTTLGHIRDRYPRMSKDDFLEMARNLVTGVFRRGDGEISVAIAKVLMVISREFPISREDAAALLEHMQTYPLDESGYEGLRPIKDFDRVDVVMNPANWGADDVSDKGNLERLPDLLVRLRAILPPHEAAKLSDDAFYPDVAASQTR